MIPLCNNYPQISSANTKATELGVPLPEGEIDNVRMAVVDKIRSQKRPLTDEEFLEIVEVFK